MTTANTPAVTRALPLETSHTHHRNAIHVNAAAADLARRTLEMTGGRETYDWEGNGIRIRYSGDRPDGGYGDTERQYWNETTGAWTDRARTPSQSGTGLMNLQIDHFADTNVSDPVIEAKITLAWALLDPNLDLVRFVIANNTTWQDLTGKYARYHEALEIRLAEIVEQKVLENPGAGLSLQEVADGKNIVGWMSRTLDGAVFNTMRRIVHNELETSAWDTERDNDQPTGRTVSELDPTKLPTSAEDHFIATADDLANARTEDDFQAQAANIRRQELTAHRAMTLLTSQNLPLLVLPDIPTRKAMIAQLTDNPGLAYDSVLAWHNLISTNPIETDRDVPDEWLELWQNYEGTRDRDGGDGGSDHVGKLLAIAAGGHRDRIALIVRGLVGLPEPLSRNRLAAVAERVRGNTTDTKLRRLISKALTAWDEYRTTGDSRQWDEAAAAVVEYPVSSFRAVAQLDEAFISALSA